MLLLRDSVLAKRPVKPGTKGPLQATLGEDPWKVMLAAMLLCRARRAQAEPVLKELLVRWPDAASLARSDTSELEAVVRPCGLHRSRARQMQRCASLWHSEAWEFLSDLPGVGDYVNDSVAVFCFGCKELECSDHVLKEYLHGRQGS